jgi:AcrR family transcriptional regulator
MARTAKGSGRDNRRKILETAMDMIGRKGVDKITLSGISEASGISKGTLYYYYSTKNDLIFDIADLHMEKITQALFNMIDDNGSLTWERLLTAFFTTLLSSDARSRLHIYLVNEAISGNESLKKRFQSTYRQWFDMVDEAFAKMQEHERYTEAHSKLLVAAVDGFILQTLLDTDKTRIKDIVALMLRLIGR